MRYFSGELVNLGDKVSLSDGALGEVVCSIDTRECSTAYSHSDWEYLKHGILVAFLKYGLIYYERAEADLHFLERAASRVEK